jgi:hypothetical protein
MKMHDTTIKPMTAESVEWFEFLNEQPVPAGRGSQ